MNPSGCLEIKLSKIRTWKTVVHSEYTYSLSNRNSELFAYTFDCINGIAFVSSHSQSIHGGIRRTSNRSSRIQTMWLRYVVDTFVVCTYGEEKLQEFLIHLNNRA